MKYLTLNELCKELAISTATAKNWIKLGKINSDFSVDYVKKLKKDISNGNKSYLKSRRNKKYVSGNFLYKDYVSKESKNIQAITNLISEIDKINNDEIQFLIAECALQLMNSTLQNYLNSNDNNKLIEDLITDKKKAQAFLNKHPELFQFKYIYEENEDILGLLYISLSNIGERKSRGAYFTPTKIVKKLVKRLKIKKDERVIDPCCGTGNFLLQLPKTVDVSNIFGSDIDEISVKITRLNLFLKHRPTDINILYSNIVNKDFLYSDNKYNYIIGNPPWGSEFSEKEKIKLRKYFCSATGKNIESYDVFIEKSLNSLNKNGILAFVLPEAILNVQSHKPIREFIKERCNLKYLEFLGNAFDGVHCPSIIMQLEYTDKQFSCLGAEIKGADRIFIINKERDFNEPYISCDDNEYELMKKLYNDRLYLKDNAEFALGIVTGNNKELISNTKTVENEVILKGSDIIKYGIKPSDNYIIFTPEKFQQVAPESFYRADEKLFYRFIGDKLVFAYDNEQRLSLNSCNILIPHLKGYDIKYIMAILNSSVAQFIFSKKWGAIKVLRSHIENIPIPKCENQPEIISLVDKLIKTHNDINTYNILDKKICELYDLTDFESGLL